jgi:hypothetical protein
MPDLPDLTGRLSADTIYGWVQQKKPSLKSVGADMTIMPVHDL